MSAPKRGSALLRRDACVATPGARRGDARRAVSHRSSPLVLASRGSSALAIEAGAGAATRLCELAVGSVERASTHVGQSRALPDQEDGDYELGMQLAMRSGVSSQFALSPSNALLLRRPARCARALVAFALGASVLASTAGDSAKTADALTAVPPPLLTVYARRARAGLPARRAGPGLIALLGVYMNH